MSCGLPMMTPQADRTSSAYVRTGHDNPRSAVGPMRLYTDLELNVYFQIGVLTVTVCIIPGRF